MADTTVGFDDLSPGATVAGQYSASGVVFGPLPGGASGSQPTVVVNAPGQAHSGSHVADIGCLQYQPCPNEGIGTYIPETTGTFSTPRSRVSVYVGLLGSSAAPPCAAASTASTCAVVQLLAFDSSGHQIAASSPATVTQGAGVQTQLSVSTPSSQIVGFEVSARNPTDNQKDVAIDDLSFDTPSQPPPPDFTVTPQSTNVTVEKGHSAGDTITIGRIGGSTGSIQFDTGALPTGVHAVLAPNPADTQTTLTLSADPDAPSTSQTVTVTAAPLSASAGALAHSFALNVRVESPCDDVVNGNQLLLALEARCTPIHIDDSARIDVSQLDGNPTQPTPAEAVLYIPDGITIESDRSATRLGGLLYMSHPLPPLAPGQSILSSCPDGACTEAMLELGSGTRISGLRLAATYDVDDTDNRGDQTDGIEIHDVQGVLIDNNEISGWPEAGVDVHATLNHVSATPRPSSSDYAQAASRIRITGNFIHDNVQCEGGYGVSVGDNGLALIDRNVFDFDRHDVAGGNSSPGAGYIAEFNFVLTDGPTCGGDYNQHFDMHGSKYPGTWVGGAAGQFIAVRDNAIRGDQSYGFLGHLTRPAFELRGIPTDRAIFAGNVMEHQDEEAALRLVLHPHNTYEEARLQGKWRQYLVSHHELFVSGNQYGVNTSQQIAVGDFDGNGTADAFVANGTGWFFSSGGMREWRFLNASPLRLNQLGFGDFNGDGKTDVFTQRGDSWLVSYGGTGPLRPLPAGSNIPMSGYRFYDFDGDRRTDIFRANGTRWYYSSGGASPWKPLAASSYKVGQLRFCDFNGDGKTDVFSLANHQWSVSYGGVSEWKRLNKQLSSNLDELSFGDFDGDGRCDIARVHAHRFQVSWGGTSAWKTFPGTQATFGGTLLGTFRGGRQTDILEYAHDGNALDKFKLWIGMSSLLTWSQQKML